MNKIADVKVIVISDWDGDYLEGVIQGYLENNYKIQDSTIQFNSGTVDGVYVFIKQGGSSVKE